MGIPLRAALATIGAGLLRGAWAMRPEATGAFVAGSNVSGVGSEKKRGEFSQDCAPFPGKRVILVTVDDVYMEMFRNWLVHAKPFLQDTEHLHVIAEEDQVVPKLIAFREKHGLGFTVAAPGEQQVSLLEGHPLSATGFGSDGFGGMMRKRPDYIHNFLQQGCSVLFIDIDTVLLHDPFEDIQASGDAEIYLTNNDPRLGGGRREACGCFLYMHPTEWTLKLVEDWAVSCEGKNKNQGALNEQLRARGVQMGWTDKGIFLPVEKYPPGMMVSDRFQGKYKPGPDPTMYHANWVGGIAKKTQLLMDLGQWEPDTLEE